MSAGVFSLRNVWKRYGATIALRGVSLELGRGLSVIVGPNGSGKTTLVRVMLGLAKPDRGEVEALGVDPWRHRGRVLGRVGVAIEGMALPWWLSGFDALRLYSRRWGVEWSSIEEAATLLGVTSYWKRPIISYSAGMRKRLILAMAFSGTREAVVLDEPYTLLDRSTIEVVDGLVARLSREVPVVVASHMVTDSMAQARQAVVLHEGSVVAVASVEDLAGDYACPSPDLWSLLAELLDKRPPVERLEYSGSILYASIKGGIEGLEEWENKCQKTLYGLLSRYEKLIEGGGRG